ncbi:hypothetical protein [Streptococcus gordonii]|uniref:hypothetical protein n=1 Tax=Streptococcus gordonii TaxID=1302 RepID=UPI00117DD7C9|nr:hypothetical protein [Streptococcus gordonii]
MRKTLILNREYAERAISESVQEIDNLKVKAKERDFKVEEQKNQLETINKLVENNAKLTHVSILNAVMSENIAYGTIYKQYMDLLPLAKTGDTFQADDLFCFGRSKTSRVERRGYQSINSGPKDLYIQRRINRRI